MKYVITKRTGIGWSEQDAMPCNQYDALIDCVLEEIAQERRAERRQSGRYSLDEAAGIAPGVN